MNTDPADLLSLTFAALADPTRRAILARLARGEATVSELAQPFPISVQAVSAPARPPRAPIRRPRAVASWAPTALML